MVLITYKIIYISCGPQKTSVNCMMGLNDFHSVDVLSYESFVPIRCQSATQNLGYKVLAPLGGSSRFLRRNL